MKERTRIVLWDTALAIGILLFFFWDIQPHYTFIVGFSTILILTNAIRNHIAAYKLSGKIY
jgi:hypothetical protein